MRALLVLLAVLFASSVAQAQEPELEARVGSARQVTRIVLVIDASGSMAGPLMRQAANEAIEIVSSPGDGLDVAIVVFNDRAVWYAPREGDLWFHLPAADEHEHLNALLESLRGTGNTHPGPALAAALSLDATTVLLLTDGQFSSDPTAVIQHAQADGGPQLVLMRYGNNTAGTIALEALAAATGAVLWERAEPELESKPHSD